MIETEKVVLKKLRGNILVNVYCVCQYQVFMSVYLKKCFWNISEYVMYVNVETYMQMVVLWILISLFDPASPSSHKRCRKPSDSGSIDLILLCGEILQQHYWIKVGIKCAVLPECPASGNNPLRSIAPNGQWRFTFITEF